jgi:hypothetical protein
VSPVIHEPEDGILHSHRPEYLKSFCVQVVLPTRKGMNIINNCIFYSKSFQRTDRFECGGVCRTASRTKGIWRQCAHKPTLKIRCHYESGPVNAGR